MGTGPVGGAGGCTGRGQHRPTGHHCGQRPLGQVYRDHGRGSVSSYGYDEKSASSGSMSPAGLAAALQAAGVKLDFIGFDTCAQKRRS